MVCKPFHFFHHWCPFIFLALYFFKPEVLHKTVESRVALAEPFHGLFLVPWGNQISPETQSGNLSPSPFLPWYSTCPFHREQLVCPPPAPSAARGRHKHVTGQALGWAAESLLCCDTSAPQRWIAPQAFIKPWLLCVRSLPLTPQKLPASFQRPISLSLCSFWCLALGRL